MPLKRYAIFKITPSRVFIVQLRGREIKTNKMFPALIGQHLFDTREEAIAHIPKNKGVYYVQEVYISNPKPNLN